MKHLIFLFFGFILFFSFFSCTSESDCGKQNSESIKVHFKLRVLAGIDSVVYRNDSSIIFSQIDLYASDSVKNLKLGTNRILLDLPLSPHTDTVKYVFRNTGEVLRVKYKRKVNVNSPECGIEKIYSDLQVLESSFDSVSLKYKNFDSLKAVNLEIFRF